MSEPSEWESYKPRKNIFGDESRSWLERYEDYMVYTESNEHIKDKILLIGRYHGEKPGALPPQTVEQMIEWYKLWEQDPKQFWAEWRKAMGY